MLPFTKTKRHILRLHGFQFNISGIRTFSQKIKGKGTDYPYNSENDVYVLGNFLCIAQNELNYEIQLPQ